MCRMFKGCSSLRKLDISNFELKHVNMKYMFEGCCLLKEIIFPNFDKNDVNINGIFFGCSEKLYKKLNI